MIIEGQRRCSCCMHLLEQGDVCSVCRYDNQNSQTPPYCLSEGTCLKQRYYTGCVLGEGGFGITYLGWDQTLSIPVAVKEYYPKEFVRRRSVRTHLDEKRVDGETYAQQEYQKGMKAFLNEAQTLAQFQALEGAAVVHDYFTENDTAYIVMEYIDGISVEEYVQKNGQMPAEQVRSMLRPVLDTLEEMHAHHIIHRDVSADNLMITRQGSMKLVDFGAARSTVNRDHTMTVMYKRGFAPEEQYRSKGETGPWSDIYSVCAVMYYLLSGVMPEEASQRLVSDRTVPLDQIDGLTLPNGWSEAIRKGMSVMAADRYQNIRELCEALGEKSVTLHNESWGQERQEQRRRKLKPVGEDELSTEHISGELLQVRRENNRQNEQRQQKVMTAKHKRRYLLIGILVLVFLASGAGIGINMRNHSSSVSGGTGKQNSTKNGTHTEMPVQTEKNTASSAGSAGDLDEPEPTAGLAGALTEPSVRPADTSAGPSARPASLKKKIPKLMGKQEKMAKKALKKAGWSHVKIVYQAAEKQQVGTVIRQNIPAGKRCSFDRKIVLTVGKKRKAASTTATPTPTTNTAKASGQQSNTGKKTSGKKEKKNVVGSLDTLLGN